MLVSIVTALLIAPTASAQDCAPEWPAGCVTTRADVAADLIIGAGAQVYSNAWIGSGVTLGASAVVAERASIAGDVDAATPDAFGPGTIISRRVLGGGQRFRRGRRLRA